MVQPLFLLLCILHGVSFEVIINGLLIVGRADLRFYRPDILPAAVRAIVTSEQTNVLPSAAVSEDELEDDTEDDLESASVGYYSDRANDDGLYFGTINTTPDKDSDKTTLPQDWKLKRVMEQIIQSLKILYIPQQMKSKRDTIWMTSSSSSFYFQFLFLLFL